MTPAATQHTGNDPRRHDAWIRVKNWQDQADPQTGLKTSSIGQAADFSGHITERLAGGDWRHPHHVFGWGITRQRTEREGPDERGQHWSGVLAEGEAPTLAKAKSAATMALKQRRTEHILAGGDVGYGDAPTGEQIRQSIAERRALEPGQSMVTERGETGGVTWERVLACPKGTIGVTESYRLTYRNDQLDTLPRGRTPQEAAAELKHHVDTRPERIAAAEASQAKQIAESARIMLDRDHRYTRLNPLSYHQVSDAWKASTGRPPTRSQLNRWAHSGVTEAEHNADWYQAALKAAQVRPGMAAALAHPAGNETAPAPGPQALTLAADARQVHNLTSRTSRAAAHLDTAAGYLLEGRADDGSQELREARKELLLPAEADDAQMQLPLDIEAEA